MRCVGPAKNGEWDLVAAAVLDWAMRDHVLRADQKVQALAFVQAGMFGAAAPTSSTDSAATARRSCPAAPTRGPGQRHSPAPADLCRGGSRLSANTPDTRRRQGIGGSGGRPDAKGMDRRIGQRLSRAKVHDSSLASPDVACLDSLPDLPDRTRFVLT